MADTPYPIEQRRRARWQLAGIAIALAIVSLLVWKYTALAELADPERLTTLLARLRASVWSAPLLLLLFVVAGLVLFPVTALFIVTAAILDPVFAIFISLLGALTNAAAGYGIGARYFRNTATTAGGWQLARVQELLRARGTLAIALARYVPVAPYAIFNIAAGAVGVPLRDFLAGTALALLPVIVVLTLFGAQVQALFVRPTLLGFALLLGLIAIWVGLLWMLRRRAVR